MGRYLNPSAAGFKRLLAQGDYIDKTQLLAYTNAVMNTPRRFVCVTRPSGFGKTAAAQMLAAFYSKGANSRRLFSALKIARAPQKKFSLPAPSHDRYLNQCHVLFWDMTRFVENGADSALDRLQTALLRALKRGFPEVESDGVNTLADMICAINQATGVRFYVIIDEWDRLFRAAPENLAAQKRYLNLLCGLFKDAVVSSCFCGVFMTGVLPIRKHGSACSLNHFTEFTMTDPGELAEFTGFTEKEAQKLCTLAALNFSDVQDWTGGYCLEGVGSTVFKPRSIMSVVKFRDDIGADRENAVAFLKRSLPLEMEGLKESLAALVAGERRRVDVGSFLNDLVTLNNPDQALTLLVHLGFLTYDESTSEVFIPNEEVLEAFILAFRHELQTDRLKASQSSNAGVRTHGMSPNATA